VTLPISEILFSGFPNRKYQILTYEAKWMVDSPYYSSTVPRCPAELTPELAERVRSVSLSAAAAVQLRDYGRIDLRVRASDGAVFVLEANPNPDITVDSGFVRAAQASGRTHASVICEILERAKERVVGRDFGR
jgi:D-alanine-D-alanine ligase